MGLGLAWLVVNYLAGPAIPFMAALGNANFIIGFSLIVIGLLMTMRWR
ncbi:Cell division protein CrgA [Pseudonocardia sp. Ae707_Ps1]|nr:Cell division protein CrgA [Pseudonocardia sp. Ae707_Ps1]